MDSNTAYHFSRLLQTTPYLGHCSRVVKMERYRVCAAGREEEWREKFPRFRETRIVTRHRATRPVLITFRSASNFTLTRLSARRIFFLLLLFFPFYYYFPRRKSIPRQRKLLLLAEGDRSAETISPPFLSPPLLLDEPIILRIDRSRGILPHVIVSKRYASNRWDFDRNRVEEGKRGINENASRFTFNRFHTPRIITSGSRYRPETRASNPFHLAYQLRSIGNDSSVNSNPAERRRRMMIGSIRSTLSLGFEMIHPSLVLLYHTSRGGGTIRVTDRN